MPSAPLSVAPVGAILGEGPVWVARERALWFVDIKGRRLHRFDPAAGDLRSWDAPAQPGWILPADDGGFLVGLQGGIHAFDPGSGAFAPVAPVEADLPGNRLNDACTDPEGRIWLGSMDDAERDDTGRFYRFEAGRVADAGIAPVCITNGPAVSPDGRILYHVDTLGRTLHACDLARDGTLGPSRVFARIEEGAGYPDGPTVDSEGHVWIGLFAGWAARRYAPDGRLVETVRFPVANVTKLAFGGEDLKTVYATTAAKDLDAQARAAQPDAGNLFSFRADVAGAAVTPAATWRIVMRPALFMAALLASLGTVPEAGAAPALHPLFSDHAVLQRDRPIAVWGTADPGERVIVTLGGASRAVRAGPSGGWRAELPAMPAGGPHRLAAVGAGAAAVAAEDVLIGDVWLCSGQSNMELPMRRALNADGDIGAANDAGVRVLTVPQGTALAPARGFAGEVAWRPVTPASIAEFSAACYFMVRELRRGSDVPVGAIDASWGGTRIRSWTDEAGVRAVSGGEEAGLLALYRGDPAAANARFSQQWGAWWRERTGDAPGAEPWHEPARLAWRPVPRISYWEQWGDPAFADFNGVVWMRRTVTLNAEEAARGGTLSLGVIDEIDQVWINGTGIGNMFSWSQPRDYRVAPGVLRAGANEIVVNIVDGWGNGGFQGPAERLRLTLADGTVKPLGEDWHYSVAPAGIGSPPRTPWDSHAGVSLIYNAMIAPLGDFGLKGVAWYQGESDVGISGYADRLAAMMAGWRRQFGQPALPFLIVGLANYGPYATAPVASGWAELREAQRLAAARDPRAALVVAMDLGERLDIHPTNKQEVGRRLARAARALAYGSGEPVGPQIVRARRAEEGIVLDFAGVTGRLTTWSGMRALAFELCAETQQSCRFADAAAEGTTVRIADDGRPATRVRHAWADSPVTNLYDEAPLPVGPFEAALD